MHSLIKILALFSIWSFSTGNHLEMLQIVAWANMFATNAIEMSCPEAVTTIFSPDGACGLCEIIAEARQDEQTNPSILQVDKEKPPLVVLRAEPILRITQRIPSAWRTESLLAVDQTHRGTPTPPPRSA